VAITGAGSGIGRALAVALAAEGCHVALSDIDESGLTETVDMCAGHEIQVSSQRVDVADRRAMFNWAERVVSDHGKVNLIFNNAGVALSYTVESMSFEDLEWIMGVNFWGVVNGTKAFLPHLATSGEGHIVNLSSVFGLIGIPSQSGYNASKFAVRGFTEALRIELKSERSPVSCTTVLPGGVKTNIVRNARLDSALPNQNDDPDAAFQRTALTTPEDAAKSILRAVRSDRRRVLVGPDAKVLDILSRLPAGVYEWPLILGGRIGARRSKAQR